MKPDRTHRWTLTAISVLVVAFLAVAGASYHTWPAEVFNYDLIHDLNNARNLAEGMALPVHGSVSSFGVFNPPGVSFGLLPGYLLSPGEPVFAMRLVTILLSALTLTGLFLLLNKRFGLQIAFWSCLLYLVSSTGWYFMAELRPRAHPLFLVWIFYFLDLWFNDRKPWALGLVLVLLSAALYWMLEIAPLFLALILLVLLFRSPIQWGWLAAAVALSLVIWAPYLKFQVERNFLDLRVLLMEQEPAHKFARYFHQQLREAGLKRTKGYRAHTFPDYRTKEVTSSNVEERISSAVSTGKISLWQRTSGHLEAAGPSTAFVWIFPFMILLWLLAMVLSLERGRAGGRDEPEATRCRWMIWLTVLVCGGIVFILTFGEPAHIVERRFLWIWIAFAPGAVLSVHLLVDRMPVTPRLQRLTANVMLLLTVSGFAIHGTAFEKSVSWLRNGLGTVPAGEFSEVVDLTAAALAGADIPPRIGYDIPFLAWIPAVHEIDGNSRIGIQYDLMLDYRHGIRNLNTGPLSVSPDDAIRIVEHSSAQPWRQSYLDLSGFPAMEVFKKLDSHTILIKPSEAP